MNSEKSSNIVIAFTGPESSGKSTISKFIAASIRGKWCPEFARNYLEKKSGKYNQSDLDTIAKGQHQLIKTAITSPLAVLDTEILVLKIWSEYKFGSCSSLIQELWDKQNISHYFLCDIDLPWEADPLREHPDITARKELFSLYEEELRSKNCAYSVLSGSLESRQQNAKEIISRQFSLIH